MNKLQRKVWFENYQTKRRGAHAAKLKKSNIELVAKAISERLDTKEGSVAIDETGIKWVQIHILEQEHHLKFGEYLVMSVWVKVLSPYDFERDYEKVVPYLPSYFVPNENEVKILKLLSKNEYYWGYDYICDETGLTRVQAKEAIDRLRLVGAVNFLRGLMTEDGEVAGSGFGVDDNERAEALLYRYYGNGKTNE